MGSSAKRMRAAHAGLHDVLAVVERTRAGANGRGHNVRVRTSYPPDPEEFSYRPSFWLHPRPDLLTVNSDCASPRIPPLTQPFPRTSTVYTKTPTLPSDVNRVYLPSDVNRGTALRLLPSFLLAA